VPKYLLYGNQLIDTAENEANRDLLKLYIHYSIDRVELSNTKHEAAALPMEYESINR
jgi:hypothetical protein